HKLHQRRARQTFRIVLIADSRIPHAGEIDLRERRYACQKNQRGNQRHNELRSTHKDNTPKTMMRNASTTATAKSIAFAIVRSIHVWLLILMTAPWFGTWKLDFAKSNGNPETRFKKVITRIEPHDDGLKVIYDAIGVRGGVTHMEWTGKFDGKDYPVEGVDYVLTNAYTRLDEQSYQIVIKVDGAVAATAKVVVATDGKTLTTSTVDKNARGESVTSTTVYDR